MKLLLVRIITQSLFLLFLYTWVCACSTSLSNSILLLGFIFGAWDNHYKTCLFVCLGSLYCWYMYSQVWTSWQRKPSFILIIKTACTTSLKTAHKARQGGVSVFSSVAKYWFSVVFLTISVLIWLKYVWLIILFKSLSIIKSKPLIRGN